MTFADLVTDRALAVPAQGDDLNAVLHDLVERAGEGLGLAPERMRTLARDLASGSQGEIVRVNEDVILVLGRVEEAKRLLAGVAVSPRAFSMDEPDQTPPRNVGGSAEETEPRAGARAVVLLLTPRSLATLREEFVPALVRTLRDEERTARLLAAASPADVRALEALMRTELRERLLVEDALTPLKYRIYPDTPLHEVVDLMIRRQLHAVPVVGENLEVLGIISVGDVLVNLLPARRKQEGGDEAVSPGRPEATARDIMTRTVMCVSEDQSLLEVANLMMNRDVDQLPVIREGEFIGFLTRDAILGRLFGGRGGA